jgi:hypothetical protein
VQCCTDCLPKPLGERVRRLLRLIKPGDDLLVPGRSFVGGSAALSPSGEIAANTPAPIPVETALSGVSERGSGRPQD